MIVERIKARLNPSRLKRLSKRWAVQDRAWVGRLASHLGTVRIEECRFRVDSALISDALKSRMLYRRYERTERELLRRHLVTTLPVVELGGGIGVVACVVNKRLSNPRQHVVVEANPRMLPLLELHREMNQASFTLVHGAIAYGGTHVRLETTADLLASQTRTVERGEVSALQLRRILEQHPFESCTLVCDIEGAEIDLVEQEIDIFRSRVAMLVVEEHPEYCSAVVRAAMFRRLEGAGFARIDSLRKVHVLRNRELATRTGTPPSRLSAFR